MTKSKADAPDFSLGAINYVNGRPVFVDRDGIVKRFKSPYDRVRSVTVIEGESMTDESHRESCDIHTIIRQFDRTGLLPPDPRGREPQYGDVSHLNRDLTSLIQDARDGNAVKDKILSDRKVKLETKRREEQLELEQLRAEKAAKPVITE